MNDTMINNRLLIEDRIWERIWSKLYYDVKELPFTPSMYDNIRYPIHQELLNKLKQGL